MAAVNSTQILEAGIILSETSLDASNTFANNGSQFIYFKNTSGATRNVNVIVQTTSVDSELFGNLTKSSPTSKSVTNGSTCLIGPFPVEAYNDTSGNVTFSITPHSADPPASVAILFV